MINYICLYDRFPKEGDLPFLMVQRVNTVVEFIKENPDVVQYIGRCGKIWSVDEFLRRYYG